MDQLVSATDPNALITPEAQGLAPAWPRTWSEPTAAQRLRRGLSFRSAAALYLFLVMFVVFALWVPDTFLTWGTWRSLLSDQAITCLVAVGLVVPIAAGVLDLAIGTEVGLGVIVVAWLLADRHVSMPLAIVLTLLAGAAVGTFSWLMITRLRIPSFIATLGVSSVLTAVIAWVSHSQQILNLPPSFSNIGSHRPAVPLLHHADHRGCGLVRPGAHHGRPPRLRHRRKSRGGAAGRGADLARHPLLADHLRRDRRARRPAGELAAVDR